MAQRNQNDEHLAIENFPVMQADSGAIQANATSTVTISNVAPGAVGTATISKWLKLRAGSVDYYIPMWT